MRGKLDRLVALGLFFCLALTSYKGFMKLPEVYPALNPAGFFRGLVNDRENSLIMKERHFDINVQIGKALELRLQEMKARGEFSSGDALVDRERAERALRKTRARDTRNADYVLLAEQNLARARRLRDEGWTMGWSLVGTAVCGPREPGKAEK
jgi:hypothetical protein